MGADMSMGSDRSPLGQEGLVQKLRSAFFSNIMARGGDMDIPASMLMDEPWVAVIEAFRPSTALLAQLYDKANAAVYAKDGDMVFECDDCLEKLFDFMEANRSALDAASSKGVPSGESSP